jgi:hypothetical protein
MSDIPGRLYNVARAYLGAAKERIDALDARAQEELSNALTHSDLPGTAPPPASSDPMERARAKIAALQGQSIARRELTPTSESLPASPAPPPSTDPVQTAYKILGLPPGADYPAVEATVDKLRRRCDPARFPAGSEEQAEAQTILAKVEEAHQLLRVSLNEGAGRFDKLEL